MSRTPGAKDKKPRKRAEVGNRPCDKSPIIQGHNPKLEPGYNTSSIQFMMEIMPDEPLDFNDVEEMERRFKHYVMKCAEYDVKIGNLAAYAAIGINKRTAYDWEANVKANPARALFIKKVRLFCAMYREKLMSDGKVNPVTGIFWQKNFDEMHDQQEVVLTPNVNPLGEQADANALKQKYLESTYGIAAESAESAEKAKLPEKVETESSDGDQT